MSADRLLQYPALVEPFDAALAQSVVTVDMWFVEPADVMRRRRPAPAWLFTAPFTPTLPPPPVAPDLPFLATPIPVFPRPPYPTGGMVEPVFPLRTYTPSTALQGLIPRVPAGKTANPHRARYSTDRVVDIFNALLISGRIRQTGVGDWEIVITQADVVEALDFFPVEDTSHTIVTITDLNPSWQVSCSAAHGLSDNANITISGSSNDAYNGDWTSIQVVSATDFIVPFNGGDGDATGGTWRLT